MDSFTVLYNGQPIEFHRVVYGWAYRCPAKCCAAYHWIMTEHHPNPAYNNMDRKLHQITSAEGEPVTILGSLACPCEKNGARCCTFHVYVTNGVMTDC
jgi:hypothetical protein